MITDPKQIANARASILDQSTSYLPLSPEDFDQACPNPGCLIHLAGPNAQNVLEQLQAEYTMLPAGKISGLVAYIGSRNLTMAELGLITGSFPECDTYKGGIGFYTPKKGAVEVYLFVQIAD